MAGFGLTTCFTSAAVVVVVVVVVVIPFGPDSVAVVVGGKLAGWLAGGWGVPKGVPTGVPFYAARVGPTWTSC